MPLEHEAIAALRADLNAGLAGRYEVLERIGEGSTAVVFRARDLKHDREVALKALHPELSQSIGADRFEQEIRLTAALQHAHLVSVHDSGRTAGLLWFTMPLVKGESLRQRLRRERQLPVPEAVRIARDTAQAVAAAHAQGIVHRDLKPENILLTEVGEVMVTDFGLARARGDAALTAAGFSVGTPLYMAPEQAGGGGDPDPRSDVYALGCILYEMLAGEPPFPGPSSQVVLAKHMHAPLPEIQIVRPTVSDALRAIISDALVKIPADRLASAEAMAEALDGIDSAPRRSWRPTVRRFWPALLAIPLLLLVLSGLPGGNSADPGPVVSAVQGPVRIAVLYFATRPGDSVARQLADEFTEELIGELAEVKAFQLVTRSVVWGYRDRRVMFDSIVRALSPSVVVDGSVDLKGNQAFIRVDLINPHTRANLETLSLVRDRRSRDPAPEGSLTLQVAEALRRQLGHAARQARIMAGTASELARDFVARSERARQDAEVMAAQQHPEDIKTALRTLRHADSLLRAAGAADPRWARPLIERGWVAGQRASLMEEAERPAVLEEGVTRANEALRMASDNAEALALRGTLRWRIVTAFEYAKPDTARLREAESDLRTAVTLDSTLASAWASLGFLLGGNGAFAESAVMSQRALDADAYLENATQVYSQLFFSALFLERWDEAKSWCDRGGKEFRGDWRFVECQLTLLRHNTTIPPDTAGAWALVTQLEELDPAPVAEESGRAYHTIYRRVAAAAVSALAGDTVTARAELARARRETAHDASLQLDLAYDEAFLLLTLREPEDARQRLHQLTTTRPVLAPLIARDPLFRPLALR